MQQRQESCALWLLLLYCAVIQVVVGWTVLPSLSTSGNAIGFRTSATPIHRPLSAKRTSTKLGMGLMDSLSEFMKKREGDFVQLSSADSVFGPGPLLACYGIPAGIDNDEILDMIADGAPIAMKQKCRVIRLSSQDANVLDRSVQEALEGLMAGSLVATDVPEAFFDIPVLFFSGFQNDEMLTVFNIVAREIYEETGGQASAACAKAVPNAMSKPLRQVLDEISGDHKEAMSLENKDEQEND